MSGPPRHPRVALVRPPTADLVACQLTHIEREAIDPELAIREHAAYVRTLTDHGYTVEALPELPGYPDATFVEDAAVVLPQVALVTRSGAESRRGEVPSVRAWLDSWHPNVVPMTEPATLDGGDVLVVERHIHVGLSTRTNSDGVAALRSAVEGHGYAVHTVDVGDGSLHLKTAATSPGEGTLLLNPRWVDARAFAGIEQVIEVPTSEPFAANCVRLPDAILTASGQPVTSERIRASGFEVVEVEIGEFAKAEAGVSCLSILCERIGV